MQGCDRDELEREKLAELEAVHAVSWSSHSPGVSTSHRGNEETRLLLNETRFAYSRYTEPFMTSSLRYSAMTAILLLVAAASGCTTTDTSVTYSYDPSFSFSGPKTYAWVKSRPMDTMRSWKLTCGFLPIVTSRQTV